MLHDVLDDFGVELDLDFELMRTNQSLNLLSSRIISRTDQYLQENKTDIVVVHGDTTTAMSTSLAAFHNRIPVAHVEAGLRTGDINSPFPEEFNRKCISTIASYHFTPTELSKQNLLAEGKSEQMVYNVGNTVVDALVTMKQLINGVKAAKLSKFFEKLIDIRIDKDPFVLVTGHRRENFGLGIKNICEAIKKSALEHKDISFIYPVHLNPNIEKPVNKILEPIKNVYLIPPLEYSKFVFLLQHCLFVLTDSGGIQEEAPTLGKYVLVMRDATERPEAVELGISKVIGSGYREICDSLDEIISNKNFTHNVPNPYGDGKSSMKIAAVLSEII